MAVRWVASALTAIEKRMKRITRRAVSSSRQVGYQQLWVLDASLKEKTVAMKERAA